MKPGPTLSPLIPPKPWLVTGLLTIFMLKSDLMEVGCLRAVPYLFAVGITRPLLYYYISTALSLDDLTFFKYYNFIKILN